jgi:hypothetical protein
MGEPGQPGAYTKLVLPSTFTGTLYYYCNSHTGMGFAPSGPTPVTHLLDMFRLSYPNSTAVNTSVTVTNPTGFPTGTYTSNVYFSYNYGGGSNMRNLFDIVNGFNGVKAFRTHAKTAYNSGLDPDLYVYWELPMVFTVTQFQFHNASTASTRAPKSLELYGRNGTNAYTLMGSVAITATYPGWFTQTLTGATPYTDFYAKILWNRGSSWSSGGTTYAEYGTFQIDGEY